MTRKINNIIPLGFGFLLGVIDNIYDGDLKLSNLTKITIENLIIGLVIYMNYFSKKLSLPTSFILGGIEGLFILLKPDHNLVGNKLYKNIGYISIPNFFYNLFKNRNDLKKIKNIIPLYIICVIFWILEDKLVPEEVSFRKLIDKSFQAVIIFHLLKRLNKTHKFNNIQKDFLKFPGLGWIGYTPAPIMVILPKLLKYGIKYYE